MYSISKCDEHELSKRDVQICSVNRLARRCEQPSFLINLQTSFLFARSSRIYRDFSSNTDVLRPFLVLLVIL